MKYSLENFLSKQKNKWKHLAIPRATRNRETNHVARRRFGFQDTLVSIPWR